MRARALATTVTVLATAAGLLTACASIPESTPVQVVGQNVGGGEEEPTIEAPPPGLDPLSVVRRFVEASASQTNEHQAARAYLTADAARTWDDAAVVHMLEDRFDTTPTASDSPDFEQRRAVELRTSLLGRLGPNGAFDLDRRALQFIVNLVKEGGEWRIANPPPGLLVRLVDFRSSYRAVGLSYVDASSNVLVNDRRWVLSRPESAVPGRVIGLLLGEPSAHLTGAVINELRGARTRTNVARGPDGVLTVDLTGVQQLNETQRQLAAAQIVRSIDEFMAASDPVRIQVDGEDLTAGQPQWRPADAARFEPAVEVSAGLPGLVVTAAGQVVQIGSGELAGIEPTVVQTISQSVNGELLAAVALDGGGRPQLWVGPAGGMQLVELPATTTMSEPTWRRDRPEVWTVLDGNRLMAVSFGGGSAKVQAIDVGELSRQGRITALRISRDGVRVAAVVNNGLWLGSIVGVGADTGIRNLRTLPPPNPGTQLVDVDWIGTDLLVMATASRDTPVYEATVDGFAWRVFGTSNLTPPITRIAATLGRPVLVADQHGVWSASTTTSVWQPVGHGPGAVPAYPG